MAVGYEDQDNIDTAESNLDPVDSRVSYTCTTTFSEQHAKEYNDKEHDEFK